MSFPQTRLTLIERLAAGGNEADWRAFVNDYWGPVCRFAMLQGIGHWNDAEDVASQTFAILWENRLLARWVTNRSARLRSVLCGVVRNLLLNRNRVQANRQRLDQESADRLADLSGVEKAQADAFYAAWVEDLVHRAIRALVIECNGQGKGDYVRVLYGRLCQSLTGAELAQLLEIKVSDVDNYYRRARERLSQKLMEVLQRHVSRYCDPAQAQEEVQTEWQQLGQHLERFGGLEAAVRRSCELLDCTPSSGDLSNRMQTTVVRIASAIRASAPQSSG